LHKGEWNGLCGRLRVAKEYRHVYLQGLKPIRFSGFAPGLKPRPPKEKKFLGAVVDNLPVRTYGRTVTGNE
jgi:hypothetical protein